MEALRGKLPTSVGDARPVRDNLSISRRDSLMVLARLGCVPDLHNCSRKFRPPCGCCGVMLGPLVATTGWSKANARRALTAAGKRKGLARVLKCAPRSPTYGYDTVKMLI